jgi:HNH endonuclease
METFYCPYCGVEHETTVATSVEHVVPYALGGSDDLAITTCARSNNTLGSEVDAPFLDFFPVRSARFLLGLASTKGNGPTLDLSGTWWMDGKEVRVSHTISPGRNEFKIADPTITKTPTPDGSERWQIHGDPATVRSIVEGKLRKQTKLGKTVTTPDGVVLTPENLESMFVGKEMVTPNPSVMMTISPDYLTFIRFFSKLALAIGHLHFGEMFSRSATGARLRRQMNARGFDDVTLRGYFWPETHSVKHILGRFAEKDRHVIAIVDAEPPMLVVSLFGEYDAFLPLEELTERTDPTAGREGTVWRIEMPSRRLSTFTLGDFVAERCREARCQAGEVNEC